MTETSVADIAESVTEGELVLSRAEYADRIGTRWRDSVAAVIDTGKMLIEAKRSLPHGEFEAMARNDLPFGERTARRLMSVASDERIVNRTHGSDLPPSWRTLYALTRLDDETFERALHEGIIRPDMQRKEAEELRQSAQQQVSEEPRSTTHDEPEPPQTPAKEPQEVGAQSSVAAPPVTPPGTDTHSDDGTPCLGPDLSREPHNHRAQGTGQNEWYTPHEYIEAARRVMGSIDLDPATSFEAQESIQATTIFTREDDGLAQNWHGNVWLNPPYSQPDIQWFAEKMVAEVDAGRVHQAVVLTHNYTDTAWFHIAAARASAICFTRGRIAFVNQLGEKAAPTQGQAFFYYGSNTDAFKLEFSRYGFIVNVASAMIEKEAA